LNLFQPKADAPLAQIFPSLYFLIPANPNAVDLNLLLPGFVQPGLDLNRNLLGFVLMLLDLNLFSAGFGRIAVDLNLPLQIQARMIPALTGFPQDFPGMFLRMSCGFPALSRMILTQTGMI